MLVDPSGEFGILGAAIGGGIELGIQLLKNDGDFSKVDYADVIISAAVGFVAPGALSTLKNVNYSTKAIKVLSAQKLTARTANRVQRLSGRISKHTSIIKDEVLTQLGFQGAKYLGKKFLDGTPSEVNTGK